jgi:signal transduction histidine kinase
MIRIYSCIAEQHDIRLVLLAVAVCVLSCFTALSLLTRSSRHGEVRPSLRWVAAAGTVAGAGIWSTHFVAMLAYRTPVIVGYETGLTALSIAIAVAASCIAFLVAFRFRAWARGGALFGLGIGSMHYTGMAALTGPAELSWDPGYVMASFAIGIALGAVGLSMFARAPSLKWRIAGTNGLALAIAGLHFTAMSALTLTPDPLLSAPAGALLAPDWLAVAIAVVMVMIIALGLSGSAFDQRLAERATQEAERLRNHVAELERTRGELQKTSRSLELALAAAAAGSQAKSLFLATMSHELRTPLNAIIGFSGMLDAEIYGPLGDARYKNYVKDVHDSGQHLLELVNDILDFSRADAGRLELADEVIELPQVIAKVSRMLEGQFERSQVVLTTEVDPMLPPIHGDERRMRQIMLNLLSNAAKFTPAGGRVRLSAFHDGSQIAVVIEDSGIGMAPDEIRVALERFGQVDSRLARKHEGAGLGLPLAKKLTELHGGSLAIESEVNVGTRITMTFPPDRVITLRAVA